MTDEELIQKAKDAANGEKFERLWNGSTVGYDSHSEADMALCSLLAFWTGGDAHRMDRLYRESGLMRDKWIEPHYADGSTYGQKTIERAIEGTSEFYDPAGRTTQGRQPDPELAIDLDGIREREANRAERIRDLEQRISRLLDEKAALQAELKQERERRRELEGKTEDESREWRSMLDLF